MSTDITNPNNQPFSSEPNPSSNSPIPNPSPEINPPLSEPTVDNQSDLSSNSSEFNTTPSADNQELLTPKSPTSFSSISEKPKRKQKIKTSDILILIMALVTLCSVVFGVYGFFFKKPMTATETSTEKKREAGGLEEAGGTTQSSPNYVYIGEWGIKFKRPQNIKLSYTFSDDSFTIQSELEKADPQREDSPLKSHGYARITRVASSDHNANEPNSPQKIAEFDGWTYLVTYSSAGVAEDDTIAQAIKQAVTNPENYSKF